MSLAKRLLMQEPAVNGNGEAKKFTVNVKSTGEVSVTIRTDDKNEALTLMEELKRVVNPPRTKKPYLHAGDACRADGCDGFMTVQMARKKNGGGEYPFLGCSNWPDCQWTAYVAKDEQTEGT